MSSSTQGRETGGAVRLFSAQPAASRLDTFFFPLVLTVLLRWSDRCEQARSSRVNRTQVKENT